MTCLYHWRIDAGFMGDCWIAAPAWVSESPSIPLFQRGKCLSLCWARFHRDSLVGWSLGRGIAAPTSGSVIIL